MTQGQAKGRFYELAADFFQGATVHWAEQIGPKPKIPYVTLKAGPIRRASFPRDDAEGNRIYDCSTIIQAELYTKGKVISVAGNVTSNYENTATSDMMEFVNFLESEEVVDRVAGWGMDIALKETVRDLSELQNETSYRYRAMAEFDVYYAQLANGGFAMSDAPQIPNSSGGGTADMGDSELPVLEEIEITTDEI